MAPIVPTPGPRLRGPSRTPHFGSQTGIRLGTGLQNTAEGGVDGTTVSVANSGGASGDAWSGIVAGQPAGTFSSTHPAANGSLGYLNSAVFWLYQPTLNDGYGRVYIYLTTAGQVMLVEGLESGIAARWYLWVSDTAFQIYDGSVVLQADASFAPGLNQMMRLEWHHSLGNQVTAQLWTTDAYSSGAPDKTITATANTAGPISQLNFNGSGNTGIYYDEIVGFAPAAVGPASAGTVYTDSGTIPLTIALSGDDQVASVDSGTIPVTVALSGADQVASTDSGTIPVTVALSGADSQGMIDAGTIPLNVALSGADQVASTDSGAIPITIALSGGDQVASTDSGAIPITLTLSGADRVASTDAGAIPLTITITGTEVFGPAPIGHPRINEFAYNKDLSPVS